MAEQPVAFKKKRTKRSQRAREQDSDAEPTSEAAADPGEESPSILATKLKNKLKTRNKPKSRLSFGVDEEDGDGEVFQVKKSNLSRKITLSKPSLSSSNIVPSSYEPALIPQSSQTPSYSAAYLSELKAATPSTRPIGDQLISEDADVSLDVDMVQPSTLSEVVDLTESETLIPSASSIKAAKQKRERLKLSGQTGDDFISLSLTKRDDFSQGPHPESRLVREEDELGEGDDEYAEFTSAQDRIALGKRSRKVEALKKREEMSEMIVDAEEQDEETMQWEQEQLRRGGHYVETAVEKPKKATYKPAPIPPSTPIPTLAAAIARLSQSLTSLTTSHAQNTTSLTSLGEEQIQLEKREAEMREMITKAEAKRSWFAAFREWVESVANFLDEKYPQLERLEEEQLSLLQERFDMLTQRRRDEDEDDLSFFFGTLPIEPREEQTDELGRVIPQAHPEAARGDRRNARISRRTRRTAKGPHHQEEEGYSTDSSLPPSDAADYDLAIQKLLAKGKDILSDVRAKDFQDPKLGLGKWFGEWMEQFGDSYTGAWGGLGMVSAWEFWTRLEVLGWNALGDTRTLDTFTWYLALHEYSRPRQAGGDEEPELGPDGDLVSAMMSTAIIPKVCKIIENGGFDPYSSRDVRRLIDLVEEIEVSVARTEPKFELILKSVHHVFQAAVNFADSSISPYLALNNPSFDPEAIPARRRFLTKRYKLLVNLLRWRKYAGDKFGLGSLATMLVEKGMISVAESGWEVGGEECLRKVTNALPRELLPTSLRA